MNFHPTAVVHPTAEIGDNTTIGPYCIVGERVKIGAGTVLHSHVVLENDTILGAGNHIFSGVVIGAPSQDLRWKGEFSQVIVGNRNFIREYVTVHKGTGGGNTVIGDENYIMAYSHAGHNVKIGNGCILANSVQLAGYVELEDKVNIGGLVGIHQFARVGTIAMVGGLSPISKDIPPFVKTSGIPARVYGLNVVGLRRNGVTSERRESLKKAYSFVYRSKMNLSQAIAEIENSLELTHEVLHFVEFLKNASRQGVLSREESKVAVGSFE
jgi:UDP-N-acetylglucosamine acyltransferase